MSENLIAKASVTVKAPVSIVWEALVNPEIVKEYMFGTQVNSEWEEGSTITWKGEWQGKGFEDQGKIEVLEPEKKLQYTHLSARTGPDDEADNYHTVTFTLSERENDVLVSLEQDNNKTEEARDHSIRNWNMMLQSMKELLEERTKGKK